MSRNRPWGSIAFILSLFITAPVFATPTSQDSQINASFRVVNTAGEGQEAKILIGNLVEMTTDSEGNFAAPTEWKGQLPITIMADGFVTRSFLEVLPVSQEFVITEIDGNESYEISGEATGFGRLRRDGFVDIGLVIPSFTKEDLFNFDLSTAISPESDTIRIIGNDINIPSNISLPNQRETYILPIRFNKPSYRTYQRKNGNYRYVATHAKFPLRQVVDKIRGGESFLSIVNDFEFIGSGIADFEINGENVTGDIPVDQWSFDDQVTYLAPSFNAEKMAFSMAIAKYEDRFMPTDLKFVASDESIELKASTELTERYALTLIRPNDQAHLQMAPLPNMMVKHQESISWLRLAGIEPLEDETNFHQMSISFEAIGAEAKAKAPEMLPLVDRPEIVDNVLQLPALEESSAVEIVGTYIILSKVEKLGESELKSEKRTRLWELFTPSWQGAIELPEIEIEMELEPGQTHRWEVIFLGQGSHIETADEGLNAITHITRNAVDL